MRVPRRRFGVVLLVAGLAVAAIPLIEATPDDRNFVVRIGDPEQVERVEILWTDEGAPLRQASLSFEVGSAPERVERSIPLAEGRYGVVATVWRGGIPDITERTVDVTDASEIVIAVP